MGLHGLVRATEDVDLFVRPTPDNVERLRRALSSIWADSSIDEIRVEDLLGEYPVVRYGPPDGDFWLDILASLGEATTYDDLEAETFELEGVQVRLATPATLFRLKRDTVRPIDREDSLALQERFDLGDEGSKKRGG